MAQIRPRLSLLTALLLTTIVGLSIVVVIFWREIGPLRAEARRMRGELGYLTVDDLSRPCAIKIPTVEEDTWKWRIYLPPGGNYSINTYAGHLPTRAGLTGNTWFEKVRNSASGMSTSGSNLAEEFLLEGRLVKEDDSWLFVTNSTSRDSNGFATSSSGRSSIYQPSADWLSDQRARVTRSDISMDQKSFEPGQSILILHMVRPEIKELPGGGHTSKTPDGAADGFAVWIELSPPATNSPAAAVTP